MAVNPNKPERPKRGLNNRSSLESSKLPQTKVTPNQPVPLHKLSATRARSADRRAFLPRFDGSSSPMPVLDHRRTPAPFASENAPAATAAEDIGDLPASGHLYPADRARTIVENGHKATLALTITDPPTPIGFVVNMSVTEEGRPILCIRKAMERVGNISDGSSASITVAETPLTAIQTSIPGAVTMVGKLSCIDRKEQPRYLALHGRVHPSDELSILRGEANFYVLDSRAMLVSGGDAELKRVSFAEYSKATSDPLAAMAPGLAAHLSGDQDGSLVLLSRAYGNLPSAQSAQLMNIDRFGLDLMVRTPHGSEPIRLAFPHPVSSADQVRQELNTMVRGARFKLGVG